MGYYLIYGAALVAAVLLLFKFGLTKFPNRNLYFAYCFIYIYINFIILAILGYMPSYNNPHNHWTNTALHILGIKLKQLKGSQRVLNRGKRTLYLFNHRSIFDFNVHDAICEYDANYLSSETVAYYMPLTWLSTRWLNSVFFFKRGGRGSNLQPFFKWLDRQFESKMTMKNGLIFYGQGHRNPRPDPLPLKKGMIRYSYERNLPIQMVIAFGVQDVMAEKQLRVNQQVVDNLSGKTVRYFRYPLLYPQDFKNGDEYFNTIQSLFVKRFYEIKKICEEDAKEK